MQFVGIAPFGTDAFLRSRLRAHLQQIKQDDYAIEQEGLENLTEEELRAVGARDGLSGDMTFLLGLVPEAVVVYSSFTQIGRMRKG